MAGVKPGVHILRHTFCSHLVMRSAPARAIQELPSPEFVHLLALTGFETNPLRLRAQVMAGRSAVSAGPHHP